jgi:glutathione S-transferase
VTTDLILHHYWTSPFSEKVRLVLGHKKLAWRSVIVPAILPKPDVMALTGGYRRTPFMQIGADVYCDSELMCRVIDALRPEPPLYPEASAGLAEIVAQWADSALFWAAVPYTMQPAGIAHIFADMAPETVKAFGADRAAMSPHVRRAGLADLAAQLQTYLGRVESLLIDGRPFLFGALPSIADFSVAQSIWFIRRAPPVATLLDAFPGLRPWYEGVQALGAQPKPEKLSADDAIAVCAAARTHAPTVVETEFARGLAEGDAVTVTPTDYAHDAVAGRLVGLTRDEAVIARDDPRAGRVHVHFPRIGFQVRKQQPAASAA